MSVPSPDPDSGDGDGEKNRANDDDGRHAVADANRPDLDLDGSNPDTYPANLIEMAAPRWMLWQPLPTTDADGEPDVMKVPRKPEWGGSDDELARAALGRQWAFVGHKNPKGWRSFEDAKRWVAWAEDEPGPDLDLAFYLVAPDRSDWDDEEHDGKYDWVDPNAEDVAPPESFVHVALADFDDIRDPETRAVAPTAKPWLRRFGVTFEEWSPSKTGAHALGRFELPDGVDTVVIDLSCPDFPDAKLELYDGKRYTTVTGEHIPGSATETTDVQHVINELAESFPSAFEPKQAREPAGKPTPTHSHSRSQARSRDGDETGTHTGTGPRKSREAVASIKRTADIQDVFDAIDHTRPSDIRVCSTVTNTRTDGTKDLDPCWRKSKSGASIGQFRDGWVEREGMYGLDALHLVALEEKIVERADRYPSGRAWGRAVEALRDRGAHIPEYHPAAGAGGSDGGASPYYGLDLTGIAADHGLGEPFEDDKSLLRTCILARERAADDESETMPNLVDAKPPYAALVAFGRMVGVRFEDPAAGILGKRSYSIVRRGFDDLTPAEFGDELDSDRGGDGDREQGQRQGDA